MVAQNERSPQVAFNSSESYPPHQCAFSPTGLVYIHLMKTGGLSIDAMLACRCSSHSTPCALLRDDGSMRIVRHSTHSSTVQPTRMGATGKLAAWQGSARCASCRDSGFKQPISTRICAQVYATHKVLDLVRSQTEWSQAAYVTVLREPVSRVWSFYRYVQRKSVFFQQQSLLHLCTRWEATTSLLAERAKNASLGGAQRRAQQPGVMAHSSLGIAWQESWPLHWHWQLSDQMTWQLSATATAELVRLWPMHALHRAKSSLHSMAVVGVTEDMAGFERALAARWPGIFGRRAGTSPAARHDACRIPSGAEARNPTSEATAHSIAKLDSIDDETRAAVLRLNTRDSSLYSLAKTLATRASERT